MNGVHDMGGMHGFGPVEPEANEPVFHADWEARAFALTRAMAYTGAWNIDESRVSREVLPPHVYLGSSYYARWTLGLEILLREHGLVDADELAAGHALRPGKPVRRILTATEAARVQPRGSYARAASAPARYRAGERVRARNINPATHTRLPRYVRGHVGVVETVRGCHVYPDTNAIGAGENPQWLYCVRFDGRELWGADADPTVTVSVEAWEPYLEPA
ncbi:MAG TPA: nitrile hydratase subunit beta [Xanthobacteraceae bacterium]|nr:nitrile hydratase subunit beta [Xanthobacteraceae bacterium]